MGGIDGGKTSNEKNSKGGCAFEIWKNGRKLPKANKKSSSWYLLIIVEKFKLNQL